MILFKIRPKIYFKEVARCEPEKKKSRTSLESEFGEAQQLDECGDMLGVEAGTAPSSSSAQPPLPAANTADTTLVRSAATALEKFQKYVFSSKEINNILIFF